MCGIAGIFNIKIQSRELRNKGSPNGTQNTSPRARLEWNVLWRKCHPGTRTPFHSRSAKRRTASLFVRPESKYWRLTAKSITTVTSAPNMPAATSSGPGVTVRVILAPYRDKGIHFLEKLNGIFAFALYDEEKDEYLIARDPIGVIPLYKERTPKGHVYFGSELKALEGFCDEYEPFLPGHYYHSKERTMKRWYTRDWMEYKEENDKQADSHSPTRQIQDALENAVHRQLMSDVPYGVLLSGEAGQFCYLCHCQKYAAKRIETDGASDAWWPQLHSFAIGLKGAPDLIKAREVAEYIGTVHHEINYTLQEGLDAIRDVIYFIETYDVTTVRASTPMYLLARVIKSMGIKMVLSGEGADEIFGGYLYFHKAPNARAFHEETVRKLSKLHLYDCLRANKSLAAWGVEGRVPFLDKEFLDVAMQLDPEIKMAPGKVIEKKVLREAFADMLPSGIAWRQKNSSVTVWDIVG